jgi:hypothetical protein
MAESLPIALLLPRESSLEFVNLRRRCDWEDAGATGQLRLELGDSASEPGRVAHGSRALALPCPALFPQLRHLGLEFGDPGKGRIALGR